MIACLWTDTWVTNGSIIIG